MFSDIRTTLTVIIGAVAYVVALFGFHITAEQQISLVVVILMFLGFFSRDAAAAARDKQ